MNKSKLSVLDSACWNSINSIEQLATIQQKKQELINQIATLNDEILKLDQDPIMLLLSQVKKGDIVKWYEITKYSDEYLLGEYRIIRMGEHEQGQYALLDMEEYDFAIEEVYDSIYELLGEFMDDSEFYRYEIILQNGNKSLVL